MGQGETTRPGTLKLLVKHPPQAKPGKFSLAFHRITEWSGLQGTSVGHPAQPPCPSRVTHSRLHRTASRRGWNISREGDSTTSLGSLFQGSGTLRGKKFFLGFSWNFLCFSLFSVLFYQQHTRNPCTHLSPQFSSLIWTLDPISAVRTLCFPVPTLKAASSGTDVHGFLTRSLVVVRREGLFLPVSTMS